MQAIRPNYLNNPLVTRSNTVRLSPLSPIEKKIWKIVNFPSTKKWQKVEDIVLKGLEELQVLYNKYIQLRKEHLE